MIVDFYKGLIPNSDGRTIEDIWNFTRDEREDVHDYIQWLFPNVEPSRFNPDAPLLTEEDIKAFKADPDLLDRVEFSLEIMEVFYYLDGIADYPNLPSEGQLWWITKNNHNYMRITRILNCLNVLGMKDALERFWRELVKIYSEFPNVIGTTTMDYWFEAIQPKE
jgi:Opioid growth factor receptor (OGFr) conserved region